MRRANQAVSPRRGRAFTLVEILIVVIILGILASIVVATYHDVTTQATMTNLKENLSKIRAHIQVYRNQHAGYPDGAHFGDQLTRCTDFHGDVATVRDATHIYGPYIEQMPVNPVTKSRAVRAAGSASERFAAPEADGGWWYNAYTGEFYADLADSHVDDSGTPYNRY